MPWKTQKDGSSGSSPCHSCGSPGMGCQLLASAPVPPCRYQAATDSVDEVNQSTKSSSSQMFLDFNHLQIKLTIETLNTSEGCWIQCDHHISFTKLHTKNQIKTSFIQQVQTWECALYGWECQPIKTFRQGRLVSNWQCLPKTQSIASRQEVAHTPSLKRINDSHAHWQGWVSTKYW